MSDRYKKNERRAPQNPPMTLQEVATALGLTRERVRQIEQKAIYKLKRRMNKLGHKADDLLPD